MSLTPSLFGDHYEPADPPASPRCPACDGETTRTGRCLRCEARGYEASRLELAPVKHPCPKCGAGSRGYMLWTGHHQRECESCGTTWMVPK